MPVYAERVRRCCHVLEGGWDANSLEDAQAFLGIEGRASEAPPPTLGPLRLRSKGGRQHRLHPLPRPLVAGLPWLLAVCDSRLFHRFWAEAAAGSRVETEVDPSQASAVAGADANSAPRAMPATALAPTGGPPLPPPSSSIDHEEAGLEEEAWLGRTLLAVRHTWDAAFRGLRDSSVRLDCVSEYVEVLLDGRELRALEATAAGLERPLEVSEDAIASAPLAVSAAALEQLEETAAWPLVPPDDEWQQAMGARLTRLAHVCAVRAVLPRVRRCLALFEPWVERAPLAAAPPAEPAAAPPANKPAPPPLGLPAVQAAAAELAAALQGWDAATLDTLEVFGAPASVIDARLLLFEDSLFEAVQASAALVRWYRATPDEQNFTTSVEMAMGRSQMECPDALWNHAQRCVDEGKLSMLSSVRAYLHAHLYGHGEQDERLAAIRSDPKGEGGEGAEGAANGRVAAASAEAPPSPHEHYSYSALLDVFSSLDWRKASGIVSALRACGPLVGAFIGLMGNDADAAAPHRLAALQGRQMKARFWCSSAAPPHGEQHTEVTTTASDEEGVVLAPARTPSLPSRQPSAASLPASVPSAASALDEGGAGASYLADASSGGGRQPHVWLEYTVVKQGRLQAHVLPLGEILDFQTKVSSGAVASVLLPLAGRARGSFLPITSDSVRLCPFPARRPCSRLRTRSARI